MEVMKTPKGFTLIELLIVVAIIAILAAIAIPNFLQAQTRAKVARVKADLTSVATALESYEIDFNQYPMNPENYMFMDYPSVNGKGPSPQIALSTPISYITSVPLDQFPYSIGGDFDYSYRYSTFDSSSTDPFDQINSKYHGAWVLGSDGPDPGRTFEPIYDDIVTPYDGGNSYYGPDVPGFRYVDLYNPTNGTVSQGNIVRSQGGQLSGFSYQ